MKRVSNICVMVLSIAVFASTAGCIDDLPRGWKIADTRVLGVRIEVVGDPTIAAPAPGDTARISVILAEPPGSETEPVGWAFAAGPAVLSGDARPIVFDLPVPLAAVLGMTRSIPTVGIVCSNGTPAFDPETMRPVCDAGTTRSTTLTYTLALARDGMPANHNPEFAPDFAQLDGALWEPAADALPATGCASLAGTAALPRVPASNTAKVVRLFIGDDARESFVRADGTSGREILTLSHFTSGGELKRQFSVWEGDAVAIPEGAEVDWTPTGVASVADGTLVRFWFVARDGRGGLALTTRAVCVVP